LPQQEGIAMKTGTAIAFALGVAGAAAFGAQAQTQAAWGSLVNGTKGLENFEQSGNANWRPMEDGLGATAGNGHLVTKESYKDFRIVAEVWVDAGQTNSGIFIRCQDPEEPGADSCYEVNVFDNRPGQEYATGGIVNTARVIGGPHRAAGKWNTLEITARGPQLTVMFNGMKTSEATDMRYGQGRVTLQYGGGGTVKYRKFEIQPAT
jgi:Domain of Unknown Function (DUF1080)